MTSEKSLFVEAHKKFTYKDGSLIYKAGHMLGKKAGCKHSKGYLIIYLSGRRMYVHRVVFLMFHGFLPKQIDHENTMKADNRIENLRASTPSQNQYNHKKRKDNKSGHKGVCWHHQTNKWRAYININKTQRSLGLFELKEDAALAVKQERAKAHGEFANDG